MDHTLGTTGEVSKAGRVGVDCSLVESRWGARFSASVQTGPGAYYTIGIGSLSGG